jgi:pimeloyl-ACP methyl ester carboxylesterase
MIPGVWEPWGFLEPLSVALHEAGHPVHVVPGLGRNSGSVPDAAAVVAGVIETLDLHDATIVAHSKGGLIGKYLMTHLDPAERVRGMVAICTPFAGSEYARYAGIPTLRSLAPDDPTTVKLQAELGVNTRITTISGVFDPHIPNVARLDGARNVVLDDGGHFRVMENPETVRTVLEVAS